MKKVLMAAPFQPQGRYKGGISSLVNAVKQQGALLQELGWELLPFETCRMQRETAQGSMNLGNIRNFFKLKKALVKEVRQAHPDCLYYHSSVKIALFKDLLAIRATKRKTGAPTILHIHFADYEKIMTGRRTIDLLILRWMKKYVDCVVFLSQKTMDEFIAHGLSPKCCRVVYNFTTLTYSEEQIEKRLQAPPLSKTQLLFVGSIDERKGIFDVLSCMAKQKNNVTLHVCGGFNTNADKDKFAEYQALLGDDLVFHGYVNGEEKKQIFLAADVLVLPSYGEGLPVVILEAFAAGCAILTTNVGAIPEIVKEESGVIIHPGNTDEIRAALTQFSFENIDRFRQMQARNYVLSKEYSIKIFVSNTVGACDFVSAQKN